MTNKQKELHPKRGRPVPFIYRWRTDHKTTRHTWKQYLDRLRSKGL